MASSEVFVPMFDDVRLFVRTVGDGPRMLFIPNGMYMFEDFRYLADRRTLIFYDVRNRGRSDTVTDRAKLTRGIEQDVDDLVFHPAETFGATPPVAVLQQQLLGLGAAVGQRNLELLCHQGAQVALVAGVSLGELFEIGSNCANVNQFARPTRGSFGSRALFLVERKRCHRSIG